MQTQTEFRRTDRYLQMQVGVEPGHRWGQSQGHLGNSQIGAESTMELHVLIVCVRCGLLPPNLAAHLHSARIDGQLRGDCDGREVLACAAEQFRGVGE